MRGCVAVAAPDVMLSVDDAAGLGWAGGVNTGARVLRSRAGKTTPVDTYV